MQPDSIIPDLANPQSLNRYSYVTNRPINFNDPTGHKANPCAGAGSGFQCHRQRRLAQEEANIAKFEKGNCYDRGYCTKEEGLLEDLNNFDAPKRVTEDQMIYLYYGARLAPEEVWVLSNHFGWGPEPLLMYNWAALAEGTAWKYYPDFDGSGWLENDPGDAYRHAFWNALIARTYGEDFARDFTTAHETQPSGASDAQETAFMDLHNNEVGIQIALANPSASKEELELKVYDALKAGELYVWDGKNIYFSDACPYCIYGRRKP